MMPSATTMMLAFPNRADGMVLSGGAWTPQLPLTNLQTPVLRVPARSADAVLASTQMTGDLGRLRYVRLVALVRHNLSVGAKWRLRVATDAGFTGVIWDTGWVEVWPPIYTIDQLEWEDDNFWSGTMLGEDVAIYPQSLFAIAPQAMYGRYLRIEIDDTGNPAGYVEAGRLFVADAWQPALNMAYGASQGHETDTQIEASLGGTEYFDPRPVRRVTRCRLEALRLDEAMTLADGERRLGVHGEVFMVFDPSDTLHMIRRSYLGRMRQLSALEYPYVDRHHKPIEIAEII